MRIPRIFNSQRLRIDDAYELEADASAHVLRVLRLKPGEELIVFDGSGGEYLGRLIEMAGRTAVVELKEPVFPQRESPLHTTLILPVLRASKMDMVIQKVTELGVSEVRTYFAERGLVKLTGSRLAGRLAHWRRVAVSASEQSGRTRPPAITEPHQLSHILDSLDSDGTRLMCVPGEQDLFLGEASTSPVCVITGPEGGLNPREISAARDRNFQCVSLGPRTLRTETAPMVVLSVLQFLGKGLESPK